MTDVTVKEQIIGEMETLHRRLASGDINPQDATEGIRQCIDRLEALPDSTPSVRAGGIGTAESQADLAESERRFRTVFDQSFQLMGQLSTEGVLQVINGKAMDYLKQVGVDPAAVIGKHFWDTPWWSHSEIEKRRLQDAIAKARQGGTVRYETTHPFGDGIIHIDFSLKPVCDDEGRVILLIAEGRDITDHKAALLKLKESEERFRALAESSPDTIMRFDPQGRHLYVNPVVERDVGIPVSAWIGKTHREMGFPEDLVMLWEDCLQQVFRTGREHQVEFMLPNGRWKDWILAPEIAPDGRVRAVMTSARDITKRKQAEMSLDKEKKFNQLLLDTSPALIVAISNDGKTLMMNKALLDIMEYSPEEIINTDYLSTFVPEEDRPILANVFQQIVRKGKATVNENRIISKSGRIYLVEWHGRPVIPKDGNLEFFVGVGIDITERRQAEAALESVHRQMAEVVNSLPDASFVVDKEQRVIAWNKAMEEISGVPKEEMMGKGDHEYAIPFYGDRRLVLIDILFLPNAEIEKKYENIQRRGHTIYGEAFTPNVYGGRGAHLWGIATPLFDEAGNIIGAIETLRDFTEHKEMEIALRRSENLFRSLFENAGIGIALTNEEGLFLRVNPRYAEITGYDAENLLEMTFIDITHPDDIATNQTMYKELIAGKRDRFQMEKRYIRKDGGVVWARLTSTMVAGGEGMPAFFVSMVEDITERKRAENSLQESETRFRMLAEKAPFGISLMNPDLSFAYLNPQFTAIFGYTREDIPDKGTWFAKAYPDADYMKEVESSWQHDLGHYSSTGISGERVYKVHCKDGSDKTIHFQSVILDTGTHVMTYEDVSSRFAAEEALRESEAKYRLLIDNANDAICVVQDDRISFANPRFAELSGYASDEISSLSLAGLVHAEDRKPMIDKHLGSLRGEIYPPSTIVRGVKKTGEPLWIDVNAVKVIWKGDPAVLYFLRDMTRQKQLEQQLLQAQKMEAIGTLAGGIAHDFNNILTGIQGYASILMFHLKPDHPYYAKLKNIEEQVRSGAHLTGQLLGFASGSKYEVHPADLNELIEKSSAMFGRTKKGILITSKLQENIWPVDANVGQIEQVLLNLYINAAQAMPGGGSLSLETENIYLDEVDVRPYRVNAGKYIRISVADTGTGMDEKTRERIFEPFFTTKETGIGTGLGLATAYGIIKNHGGFFSVYSELGKGSTFHIYLPASEGTIAAGEEQRSELLMGKETILVVDDEVVNTQVTKELLEMIGYRVLTANDGQTAIDLYRNNVSEIDLVILDMIMPGLSGEQLLDIFRGINPEVEVIIASGYRMDSDTGRFLGKGCRGFIQKPFLLNDLSKKLRQVLD